jgi:hypothetical protein
MTLLTCHRVIIFESLFVSLSKFIFILFLVSRSRNMPDIFSSYYTMHIIADVEISHTLWY